MDEKKRLTSDALRELAGALLVATFCVAVLYGNLWAINRLVAANMPMHVAQLELITNAIAKVQAWAGGVL